MESISLIIPISGTDVPTDADIASYRRVLRDQAHASSVEVILAGHFPAAAHAPGASNSILIPTAGTGKIAALREGMDAASNELLVVLDPHRAYTPQAIVEVIEGLLTSDADFAIAVPRRDRHRSWWRALGRRCLGLIGQLTLGTSDVFSGLIAIRPSRLRAATNLHHARGSRLVLDLLAWPTTAHRDVPVETRPDDRLQVGPLRFDDIRQLKRLLDHRFGTMSRLVQFCMVGASGMAVDLTLYALLQLLFARFWSLPAGALASGFSWPLATAGALAIFTAMVWNFTLNRRLTFNDSRGGSIPRQFLTYALGNALGIAVSLSLRLFLPQYFGFFARHRLAAAVVGIIIATGISFSMSRWVVFIRRPAGAGAGAVGRASLPVKAALQESAAVS
jgi:dolichol-phosphate mannosyltransferase